MIRATRTACFAALLSMALATAGAAYARTETLRWTHPDPGSVESYRVYWGTEPGSYANQLDVGIPATDANGNYVYALDVPDTQGIFVVVTAARAGLESDNSNEEFFAGSNPGTVLGTPGRPQLVLP